MSWLRDWVALPQTVTGDELAQALVRAGLDGSETIVINGLVRIRPGVKVTPKAITLPPVAAPAK